MTLTVALHLPLSVRESSDEVRHDFFLTMEVFGPVINQNFKTGIIIKDINLGRARA